uniref:ribosomal protein L14 n=1 Tax=Balanophora yakushimensis TaxID=1128105 RepID=UPI0020013D17|nr:ribosomal protein L14 [Balanophora yakushimensis]UNQ87780.1 ribosomal protein L14 [Balanophora yakushimensis]
MIYFNITDNTGILKILCIKKINKFKIGNIIIGIIKKIKKNNIYNFKKSELIKAIIIRTRKILKRKNGILLKYNKNDAIIINSEHNPKSKKIFGIISWELLNLNINKKILIINIFNKL